jgi:hypothetical protein
MSRDKRLCHPRTDLFVLQRLVSLDQLLPECGHLLVLLVSHHLHGAHVRLVLTQQLRLHLRHTIARRLRGWIQSQSIRQVTINNSSLQG